MIYNTVKAKTKEEITNNRPAPGVLDQCLAKEYKVMHMYCLSVATKKVFMLEEKFNNLLSRCVVSCVIVHVDNLYKLFPISDQNFKFIISNAWQRDNNMRKHIP